MMINIELEDNDVKNIQMCLLRVAKLPEVDASNMRYLMMLHDKIEVQKTKSDESHITPVG
jgi:hypothetical protein